MIEFHGGRLAPDPTLPRLRFTHYALAPAKPPRFDWLSRVAAWPMYDNDRCGDCVWAAAGHLIQALSTYARGTTQTPTRRAVVAAYSAVTGYNPVTGAHDDGTVMQKGLGYWRKTGIGTHKILAFAEVDVSNMAEVHHAGQTFGALYIGINFPDSAMTQFNRGQYWDVVPGARNEGGHCVHVGGFESDVEQWRLVTWGAVQGMSQAFWDAYVEEAWIVVTPEWLDLNGRTPEGFDLYALGADLATLTGDDNPFPEVPVDPTPVDPADQNLIEVVEAWLARLPHYYMDVQNAFLRWLDSKK